MTHQKFRLVIKPGVEGAVRLAQLSNYIETVRTDQTGSVVPVLSQYMSTRFAHFDPPKTIDNLPEDQLRGWGVEPDSGDDEETMVITTEGRGISLSNLFALIETVAPEVLGQRIIYEPDVNRRPSEYDYYLH